MNKTSEKNQKNGTEDFLCRQYEQLRNYALNSLKGPRHIYGFGVILLKGMLAWIEAMLKFNTAKDLFKELDNQNQTILETNENTKLCEILAEIITKNCYPEVI